jgi:uncharacterized protein (TIGR04141 family)
LQLAAELISNPESPAIDSILPDDLIEVGEDRFIKYILFPHERGIGQGRVTLPTAALSVLVAQFADMNWPDRGLDAELRFLDESEKRIDGSATVLECISANLRRGDKEFIAYDGDFYSVDKSFVTRIDGELGRVETSDLIFPRYGGQTEPVYNEMVGRDLPDKFVLLDRELISIPGESGIEACDLVASSGGLVHLKRKGKSSVLSHLFLQVGNSCELLRRSSLARRELLELIRQRAGNEQIYRNIREAHERAEDRRQEIEVSFAFLGDWKDKTITSLPLFSRISMVTEVRRVANLGFRPTKALISNR